MYVERRSKTRYPLTLKCQYQTVGRMPVGGTGETVNISSNGILIKSSARFVEGSRLKVTIEWPTLLDGTTPLQLVMTCQVVRRWQTCFAVTFEQYQFRTMRRPAGQVASVGRGLAAAVGIGTQPPAAPRYASSTARESDRPAPLLMSKR